MNDGTESQNTSSQQVVETTAVSVITETDTTGQSSYPSVQVTDSSAVTTVTAIPKGKTTTTSVTTSVRTEKTKPVFEASYTDYLDYFDYLDYLDYGNDDEGNRTGVTTTVPASSTGVSQQAEEVTTSAAVSTTVVTTSAAVETTGAATETTEETTVTTTLITETDDPAYYFPIIVYGDGEFVSRGYMDSDEANSYYVMWTGEDVFTFEDEEECVSLSEPVTIYGLSQTDVKQEYIIVYYSNSGVYVLYGKE